MSSKCAEYEWFINDHNTLLFLHVYGLIKYLIIKKSDENFWLYYYENRAAIIRTRLSNIYE